MSRKSKWSMATLPAAMLAVTGCDVDKVEDGEMPSADMSYEAGQMPEYEVRQTQEGRLPDVDVDVDTGKLPTYEIETPDVEVGTKEVGVDVPDVDVDVEMEEKTMTVPDIDIGLPDDDEQPE